MSKLVTPKVYLTGFTTINTEGIVQYLTDTDQLEFLNDIEEAKKVGLSDGEILCSMYAKMCYASLTLGKNNNITKIRDINSNIVGTIESGHGSVFEHCNINFIVSGCSRIFTHEQVRHRAGAAYSQTSGRYVRTDEISFVYDPILNPVKDDIIKTLNDLEIAYKNIEDKIGIKNIKDFNTKKKITSALRRILPNGQSNEIGISLNLRSLRHIIQLRTNRHAEWEIRLIYNQICDIIKCKYPAIFSDMHSEFIDDAYEYTFTNQKI